MTRSLDPGWYVMCYHDVRWGEPTHLRGLGICHPPDRFGEHLDLYAELGSLVSLADGLDRVRSGRVDEPIFSLTFDDGYRGVIEHAAPALDDLGVSGMLAINNEFIDGTTTFWRAQLCWIHDQGGLPLLVARLRSHGYTSGSVRDFTMDNYNDNLLEIISETYLNFGGHDCDDDLEGLHLDATEVVAMRDAGWEIANHSARHLPLLEDTAAEQIRPEYESCEVALNELLGSSSRYWVAPFDRPLQRSLEAVRSLRECAGSRVSVLVDDRPTEAGDLADRVMYRVFAPVAGNDALFARLRRAARRSKTTAPHRRIV